MKVPVADLPKPDEIALLLFVLKETEGPPTLLQNEDREWLDDNQRSGHAKRYALWHPEGRKIPCKRLESILRKWISKGYWDCGVSDWTGWFTFNGLLWACGIRATHSATILQHCAHG